ncbi:MAG: DUF420 domain-containing protein [Planctomycetaceae bacterium]|nr:DUF420 domain-containing protein [Planctomycetaceae bacterium]
MSDGFLGYKTSFMLDFVVCALVIVVPLLLISLFQVRYRRAFETHRKMQLLLAIILLAAVGAFEVDLQLIHGGWENIVAKQGLEGDALATRVDQIRPWLWFHLMFAITTPVLWIATIIAALRNFGRPAAPGAHSRVHRMLGWASTVDITLTSVTGLIFYYVAFVR